MVASSVQLSTCTTPCHLQPVCTACGLTERTELTSVPCLDDEVKEALHGHGLPEGLRLHVAASWITGIAVVGAMQPFDFAATRLMNQRAGTKTYQGLAHCLITVASSEGIRAIYQGVIPNYLRFGPYCILVFVFLEQLKQIN